MAQYVQNSYEINPPVGYVGDNARPSEPFAIDTGLINIPSGAAVQAPRPGMAVYWNATANAYEVPETTANRLLVCGILHYRRDRVQNASDQIVFSDGAFVEVCIMGTIWVEAHDAIEYNQVLSFRIATPFRWSGGSRVSALADAAQLPVVSATRGTVAAGDIIEARVGYGRVI